MTRLLVCFMYFFRGIRILPWVCVSGAVMIAIAIFVPGSEKSPLPPLGAVFLAGFPILVGGAFYRQLIGNRRMALVPGLRFFATGALFLLALCGAALAAFIAAFAAADSNPWRVGQLAFAMVSLYLLVSQWIVGRHAAVAGFVFLPFIVLGLAFSDVSSAAKSLLVPWAWLALAGLGWLWLVTAISRKDLSRRWVVAAVPGRAADSRSHGFWRNFDTPLDALEFATAAESLMRGSSDSWRNRVKGALMIALLIPAVMSASVVLMSVLTRNVEARHFGELYLGASFVLVCVLPKVIFGEWPARLRMLWLRASGDRPELWRRTERTLLQEIVLIEAIHLPVAMTFLFLLDAPRDLFCFYLAGAVLGALTGGYAGFLARISDWSFVAQGALSFIVVVVLLFAGVALRNSPEPLAVFWLLPLLLVLALAFRTLARSRFRRMDWCRVRPKRFPRRPP